MQPASLDPPRIVPIGTGDTDAERNNAKGHLFERFMGQVFEALGCESVTRESLNVRANGIELDIRTAIRLTGQRAVVECKAYSSAVSAKAVSAFIGKLTAERYSDSRTAGWFVAIPHLTSDGEEFAQSVMANDKDFRRIIARDIAEVVRERGWVAELPRCS